MGGKLLSGIKGMYVDSSACIRIKWGESEQFRIDSRVIQGCIMSPCLFNVYMDGVTKEVKMGRGRRVVSFLEDGREWRLLGLLYADDMVLCRESEEDMWVSDDRLLYLCIKKKREIEGEYR